VQCRNSLSGTPFLSLQHVFLKILEYPLSFCEHTYYFIVDNYTVSENSTIKEIAHAGHKA